MMEAPSASASSLSYPALPRSKASASAHHAGTLSDDDED